MGISIVTSICLDDADRDRLVTRDVSQWFPKRTYGVVTRKGAYLTPQARRFIELMSPELFPESGLQPPGASPNATSKAHTKP